MLPTRLTTASPLTSTTTGSHRSSAWLHGPVPDVLLGWCWLPIAVGARLLESHISSLQTLIGLVFLLSFSHQPLTLGLVYGDESQLRSRRRLYAVAPFVLAVLVVVGLRVSLTLVAIVAGLWNAEHTLMQRFGVIRIYGRKAGDDHGRLEKPMLFAWLALAVTYLSGFVALDALVAKVGIGQTNTRSVELLHSLSTVMKVLFVPAVVVSIVLTARWVRAERALGAAASRSKHVYVLATFGIVVAVMVDPIAGFVGYVAAHAIEYFAIVHSSLRKRAATGDTSVVARVTASPARRALVYAAYVAAIVGLLAVSWNVLNGDLYAFLVLFFGGLHILYDGFVWKLRKPATAASLGIGVMPAVP